MYIFLSTMNKIVNFKFSTYRQISDISAPKPVEICLTVNQH